MQSNPYSLALPPRHVPLPIRAQLLLGGFFGQFGWLWLGFTLIFVWAFGLFVSPNDLYFYFSEPATTTGVVSSVESTSASENDTPVYANHYTFRVEQLESEFRGVSYTTGHRFSAGNEVTIEYSSNNPNLSRIEDTRSGVFGLWILCIVGIFPAIGIVFVSIGLVSGLKANRLLKHGKVGLGTLIAKEPTNVRVNNQPVYKLTFEFTADDGLRYETSARSHTPAMLEDEATEQLLYNPDHPSQAVLLDSLPGEPDIDEFGDYQVANINRSRRILILPILVLGVHSLIFLFAMLY